MNDAPLMLTFGAAVLFLLITPGPGVLSTAGIGASFGYGAGVRYIVGLFIGSNLVSLAVVTGLAAVVLADERIRNVLFFASFAYLLYLAARIAFAGAKIAFISRSKPPGIGGGIALQAINPKAYAVGTALFTGFPLWPDAMLAEITFKFVVLNAVWIPIHILWLGAGVWLRRLDLAERTQRAINIAMALSMVMVVVLAAWAA